MLREGEVRYSWKSNPASSPAYEQTKYQYTGQYSDSYINLLWYGSRHYDPELGRFIQPDTIIPDPSNSQGWDRFSYAFNNPVTLTDPDGHWPHCSPGVRCVTPIADKRDVTKWLVAASVDIAESEEMQSVKEANSEFRKLDAKAEFESVVADGMKYDVKDNMLEDLGRTIKIGNNWYEYSTAGNIIYGFYGKEAGWSDFELYAGAGIAQYDDWKRDEGDLGPPIPPFYGDTVDDHYAVKFGIYLYDNYYTDDGVLTVADLLDAFKNYTYADRMALVEKPKNFIPRYYEHPTNRFYQME
jgi:RHS repeat-associated protein